MVHAHRYGMSLWILAICNASALAWSTPQNVSNQPSGSRAFEPHIAYDPMGNLHLVWAGGVDPSTSWRAYYQMFDGNSWSAPLALSSSGGTRPHLAVDGSGTVHVVYEWPAEQNIWYRKKPSGGNWTDAMNLRSGGRSIAPKIATNPAGDRLIVAWHDDYQVGGEWDIFVRTFDGSNWTPIFNASSNSSLSSEPRVCIDAAGNMHVAWSDNNLYHRRLDTSGNWGPINTLFSISRRASLGSICASSDGFVHAAYSVDDGSSDWRMFYKYYNGTWSAGTPVYVHAGADDDIEGSIIADPFNRLHMVFHNYSRIYYSTANSFQSAWSPVTILHDVHLVDAPSITIDPSLTAHVVWQSRVTSPSNWNIYLSSQSVGSPGPQGTLTGEVRDQFGSPVAGATVSTGTNAGVTNAAGVYSFLSNVGTFNVTATKPFHTSQTVNNITVTAGNTTTQDFVITRLAPNPVTNFTVSSSNTVNELSWTNPSSGQFASTMIRYKTDGYPTGPTDGTLLIDKPNTPNSIDNFTHSGLTNGTTYYYAAFARDAGTPPVYASAATASGVPFLRADFDRDGDVDQSDFGHLQACLSGTNVPQFAPECQDANLDRDFVNDVDSADLNLLLGCFSGPGILAPTDCLD